MNDANDQAELDAFLGAKAAGPYARFRKPLLIASAVLGTLLVGGFLLGGDGPEKSYATALVVRGDLQVEVTATGNLAPTNEVAVGSELSGLIVTVFVDVNDRVVKGQPLAQIDTSRLRDALASSRAAVDQAAAGVGQAQATVRQSSATLARLQEVFRLSGGKVPSRTELDSAEADSARAIANLAAARAQLAAAQAQNSSDRTSLAKATIRSPVTGVVLARQIEPGQTVAASFNTPTLFKIAEDLTSMELEVKVDEADVGQVAAGQPASFYVDAFPGRRFPASIKRVDVGSNASADGQVAGAAAASAVVSYNAVLTVANLDLILRPGMTATAEITTSEERGVLLVPNATLRFKPSASGEDENFSIFGPGAPQQKEMKIARGSKQTVYLLDTKGEPKAVAVIAGASNGTRTIVRGALKPGDRVITGELAAKE